MELIYFDNYSLTQLINDFYHVKSQHLLKNKESWDFVQIKLKNCKYGKKCYIHRRHMRNREKYDRKKKYRKKIYFNFFQSNDVVPYQELDNVHNFLLHTNRKQFNFANSNDMDNEVKNNDNIHDNINTNQCIHDNICDECDNVYVIEIVYRGRRFVTQVVLTEHDNSEVSEPKLQNYEFGYSFYHWNYYNNFKTFIKSPKYANLKKEMLSNKLYPLSQWQWTDTLIKAIKKINSTPGQKLRANDRGNKNVHMNVPKGLKISISHLMVILLYTNYDEPQFNFKKKGLRPQNKQDSIEVVKHNHSEISNFYRLLAETIMFFGDTTKPGDVFYHGLNCKLIFSQFYPKFNAPISTTTNPTVAADFCGNKGMLLVLKPDQSFPDMYFDCWCSDLNEEQEYLFCISEHLYIKDVRLRSD
eukprot:11960_1